MTKTDCLGSSVVYASIDEIKSASENLVVVSDASDAQITAWSSEAYEVINRHCSQDFLFEQQTTKRFRVDSPVILLPKPLTGTVTIRSLYGNNISPPTVTVDITTLEETLKVGDYELHPGKPYLVYRSANKIDWSAKTTAPDILEITGDWGYASSKLNLAIALVNEISDKYETHRLSESSHLTADLTNSLTTPSASDLPTLIARVSELVSVMDAHFQDTSYHKEADVTASTLAPSITTEEEAASFADLLKIIFNLHIESAEYHLEADSESLVRLSANNPLLPSSVKITFLRLVRRIAIRDNTDDHLNYNSYYQNETTGDGFTYNQASGTLRNVLRPEDRVMLWPYINRGRVVA